MMTELKFFFHFVKLVSMESEELETRRKKQETGGNLLNPWVRPWARARTWLNVYPRSCSKESLVSQEQHSQRDLGAGPSRTRAETS